MAGLGPAIHVSVRYRKDVDARDERGHDDSTLIYSRSVFALNLVGHLIAQHADLRHFDFHHVTRL